MSEQFTILVIDDDKTTRLFLKHLFTNRLKLNVVEAASGIEGIAKLDSLLPDLVIVDINMPDMNGVEVVKVIRVNKKTINTPVVILSASDDKSVVAKLASLNILDYMLKPMEILHATVRFKKLLLANEEKFIHKLPFTNS